MDLTNLSYVGLHNGQPEYLTKLHSTEDVLAVVDHFGFAVAEGPHSDVSKAYALNEVLETSAELHLGDPYIPMLYRDRDGPAVTEVIRRADSDHPVFHTGAAQGWHTDGLLEPIGEIKTTLLYCVHPARAGGRTSLLNAGRVFAELREVDPEGADLFLQRTILGRRSTLPGVKHEAVGPVFAEAGDGNYTTRYGDGRVERWYPRSAAERRALSGAVAFFRERRDDADVRIDLMLRPGQCLIVRNDLLAHAREQFIDDPKSPRLLLRSLFTRAPGRFEP